MAQLRGYIDDSQTTIPVDDTTNFPTDGGVVTIEGESVRYGRATDKALLGCERGYNSTSADEHVDHTPVDIQDTSAPLYTLQEYQGNGAPSDHFTGIGFAIKGTRYTDLDSGTIYVNTADETDPTWEAVGSGGGGLPAGLTFDTHILNVDSTSVDQLGYSMTEAGSPSAAITKNPSGGSLEIINQDGAVFLESNNAPISLQADGYVSLENGDGGVLSYATDTLTANTSGLSLTSLNGTIEVLGRNDGYGELALRADGGYLGYKDNDGNYIGRWNWQDNSYVRFDTKQAIPLEFHIDADGANHTWTLRADGSMSKNDVWLVSDAGHSLTLDIGDGSNLSIHLDDGGAGDREITFRGDWFTIRQPGRGITVQMNDDDDKADLALFSTDRGFLPNRLTTTERDAISSPPEGLVIYNTTTHVLNFYNGSAWAAV